MWKAVTFQPPPARGTNSRNPYVLGRGVMATDYDDWCKIEQTEAARARSGSPREKFVRVEDWLKTLGR